MVFNAIGALVWAVLFSSLGYVFGKAISTIIGGVSHYEMQAALAILAGGDCVVHMESLSPCSISVKALADIALVRCTGTRNVHFFGPSDMTRQNTASLKIAIGQKTVPSIAFRRSSRFSP